MWWEAWWEQVSGLCLDYWTRMWIFTKPQFARALWLFSLVQDTWCEPSWFNKRLLNPKDDKKGHFLEFLPSCSAASHSGLLCTRLLNGLIHGPFAVAQCCSLKCICSCDMRLSDAEDGNFLVWRGLCEHQPAGCIVLSQRSRAAVSSWRNNHILATSTGRFFTRPSG